MTDQLELDTIAKRVYSLRSDKKLTQKDLSGPRISAAYISRIERGERIPTVRVLRHLAALLGTTVEYLETGKKAVVTVMLEEYEPFFEEVGIEPDVLTHADISQLGEYTRKAFKLDPDKNPLAIATRELVNHPASKQLKTYLQRKSQ